VVDLAAEVKVVEPCEFFDRGRKRPRLLPDGAESHHRDDVADELEVLQAAAAACSGGALVLGVDVLAGRFVRPPEKSAS
jgi:hypothetical protein